MRAIAVFHDKESYHWANRWLKRGFWHVFVCVTDGPVIKPETAEATRSHWIRVDAQDGVPAVEVVAPASVDLASFYRREGYTVVELTTNGRPPGLPIALANCVGLAKIVLGVQAPWIVTPWQLYRYLERKGNLTGRSLMHIKAACR